MGAVLSQKGKDGIEIVISYASIRPSKNEINYCGTRKEILAVLHYIRFFSHCLLGKSFVIRTDHKSLTCFMSWRNLSTSQYFAWISELSQYDFKIEHRKGNNHTNADILSRLEHEDSCNLQCNLQPNIELNINAVSKDCE